jgi:site-specific recombinase XerD
MNIPKWSEQFRKDLMVKNYSESSIVNYVSQIKSFLSYFDGKFTEPSKINENAIKDYLLSSECVNSQRHRHSSIKLFYKTTCHAPMKFRYIKYARKERKLPIVLSVDEVQRMFDVCENKKHKVIFALLYSCSLRLSELINLKWSHIDRSRMVINIIQAKGKKDRQVGLNETLINLLTEYYREYRSKNISAKIACCCRNRIRNCIKKGYKSQSSLFLTGCKTWDELKNHLEKKFTNGMSWANMGEWHIDHIIPCSSFDLTNIEQQMQCFHYSNLQPLWAKDNLSKSDKIV